ncbi:DoxX family protein [Arcobacter sp. FWKO B]|uniref:DoxX family protein n=1 Tax=Arcobacter sp. FWKO B TaxID=2593672 RepID=UPI0018A6263A|nr:DoxX family protein [Arcobacter sp. FWKO B]QOG12582.1 DoxX family protein [Arcobacter sp. FWKO B]
MQNDIAKLILRLGVGVLMLFHGVHKIMHGIDGVKALTVKAGLPEIMAYGVYVGEVVMPILIILGLYARIASAVLGFTMVVAIYLAYGSSLLALGKTGGPVYELALIYLIMCVVIFLQGSGKFAVNDK